VWERASRFEEEPEPVDPSGGDPVFCPGNRGRR
jgi:hypothetical protein